MQKLMMICALAGPIFAAAQNGGQATVISGHASNRVQPPGVTALTDAPLVHTPSVTLDAAPLSAAPGGFATLTWYGPGTVSEAPEEPSAALAPPQDRNFMNVGVGTSGASDGVAKLMAEEQPSRRVATRVYTNRDVARLVQQLNQSIGLVKYGDTTTQLH
jgi:hypothetical protein